jgi:hypothetical protein
MCKPSTPEYFTLLSTCPYDGSTTVLGIFENMNAVCARLQGCYTSCGDEYRIECFHLQTEEDCVNQRDELLESRRQHLEKQLASETVTN